MSGEPLTLDQLLKGNYKTGEVLAHQFGPDAQRPAYTYLKGDITAAYSSKVREVRRSQVFLNLGGAVPASLVVDRVVTSNAGVQDYGYCKVRSNPPSTATRRLSRSDRTDRRTGPGPANSGTPPCCREAKT